MKKSKLLRISLPTLVLALWLIVCVGCGGNVGNEYGNTNDDVSSAIPEETSFFVTDADTETDAHSATEHAVDPASYEPETTVSPETAAAPETSAEPETTAPITAAEPITTVAPETTKAPETNKAPETTKVPETTKAPETTQTPETTKTPETTAAPEVLCGITLNGTPIERFVIVNSMKTGSSVATDKITTAIKELFGVTLTVNHFFDAPAAHEIIVGDAGRDPDAAAYGYDDAEICFKNGSLYVSFGSKWTSVTVVEALIDNVLQSGKKELVPGGDGSLYSVRMPERAAYIADPSLMPLHWAGEWDPEPWMTDFSVKIDALMCKDKNHLFTVSHRGDFIYYPENSIEAMISVWRMGGDCVEIDIQYTKDGIPIIMHDATLTRMTDVASKKGRNGLPDSEKISDWTYEQLKSLYLKEGQGGTGAALTPYRIPTLEESLVALKDRLFIIFDKQANWKYCDLEGVQTMNADNYLLPYMIKTGNVTSVLLSYGTVDSTAAGTLNADQALKIQKYVCEKTGQKMFIFLRGWTTRGTAAPYAAAFEKGSMTNSAVLVNGAYTSERKNDIAALCRKYPDTLFAGWTITDDTDNKNYWDEMYDIGMRSIMTNNIPALVKYAATKK